MNKEIKLDSIILENNMEHSSELQSKVLDWLRFPMILLVVYIHYYGDNIPQTSIVGCCIYDSIRITISHVISRAAVPIFFLISGYYFFYNTDSFNYKIYIKKLRKRVNTILIPYLIWNGIFILQIVI